MFSNQFEIIEDNKNHIQYKHIRIDNDEFNKFIIKSIFEDKELYRYITNWLDEPKDDLKKLYPIKQLISLIKNLKKEYIRDNVPKEIKKKICKSKRAKLFGVEIDVNKKDWEQKFDQYLEDNISGYDVVAKIILSKIIEEKFEANVFVTKLSHATNRNMKVFGMDTVHFNEKTNTMFYGESKLTNTIDLGLKEHSEELDLIDFKINEECQLLAQFQNDIRSSEKIKDEIVDFGIKMTINRALSFLNLKKEEKPYNVALVFFVAHGENYDYEFITNKVNLFRKKIHLQDIEINCVTLPIKDKNDFIKRVEEVISEYE